MTSLRPKAGDKALEINVFDSAGNMIKLSEKKRSGRNSLIVFYRGHW